MKDPRVEELLDRLLDLPASERASYLDRASAGDDVLRREVEALARAFDSSARFLRAAEMGREALPSRIGRYPIQREIDRGGMGVVYLAEDPELSRPIALKTLPRQFAESRARRSRLREEARALARLSHPNVAQVYAYEEVQRDDGAPESEVTAFLTMEYVPGETMRERLRGGTLSLEECLDLGRQVAAALEAAHARGIVHRDLKPENVKVTPDGWLKVLDFGLAAEWQSGAEGPRGSRGVSGTVGYMSPEQVRAAALSDRSDVWSLGCLLFECLAGVRALRGADVASTLESTRAAAVDWTRLRAGVPRSIVDLLRRCLALEPTARPAALEVRQECERELLRQRALAITPATGTPSAGVVRLPAQVSSFVGREAPLRELSALVSENRLITICAPGGSGKTRLAFETARSIAGYFPDGVYWLDLASLKPETGPSGRVPRPESRESIAALAVRALSLRDQASDANLEETIVRSLAGRKLLLVADNCEHVIESAAGWIARMSESCAGLWVLATSREPLDLLGEQLFVLRGLELPHAEVPAEIARQTESVRLFEARARARAPDLEWNDDAIETAAELCRRLDGLPLAIELAASHVRQLALRDILERVRVAPLELGQLRGVAERHQSLADLIDWSHRLLEPAQQRLFRRLSIFRGGWTVATAETVCGEGLAASAGALEAMLGQLADRSLVQLESTDDAGVRFRFLDTIHTFARARVEKDEWEELEDRFLRCFTSASTDTVSAVAPAERQRWREIEYMNLIDALSMSLERGHTGDAVAIAAGLVRYWLSSGFWREGRDWCARALAAAGGDLTGIDPGQWIDLLGGSARLVSLLEDHETATERASRALSIARAESSPERLVRALHWSGLVAWAALRFDEAERHFAEGLELARATGDRAQVGTFTNNLGGIHTMRHDFEAAALCYEEQLAIGRELNDRHAEATALNNLARTAWFRNDPAGTLHWADSALRIQRAQRDTLGVSLCLHTIGDACLDLGQFQRAREALVESLAIRQRAGQALGACSALRSLSRLAEREGDPERAAEIFGTVVRIRDAGDILFQDTERQAMDDWRSHLASKLTEDVLRSALARGAERDLAQVTAWLVPPELRLSSTSTRS